MGSYEYEMEKIVNKIYMRNVINWQLMDRNVNHLALARSFSTSCFVVAYHQLQLREEDIHKFTLQSLFGMYELRVFVSD